MAKPIINKVVGYQLEDGGYIYADHKEAVHAAAEREIYSAYHYIDEDGDPLQLARADAAVGSVVHGFVAEHSEAIATVILQNRALVRKLLNL